MRKYSIQRLFVLIAFLLVAGQFVSAQPYTSIGKEFWFAFMDNLNLSSNGKPVFSILVTSFDKPVSGYVELPQTGLKVNFSVQADSTKEILLPKAIYYSMGDHTKSSMGFHVVTDNPSSIKAIHSRLNFSDGTLVLPVSELDISYKTITHYQNSAFVIVSTADSNTIEYKLSSVSTTAMPSGSPLQVTLNRGETFQITSLDDLSGSTIRSLSGKKFAVFGGGDMPDNNNPFLSACLSSATSHVYDQIPSEKCMGTTVFVPPLDYVSNACFPVQIVAADTGADIHLVNSSKKFKLAGMCTTLVLTARETVKANKPITIAQIINPIQHAGMWVGDPNMIVFHPGKNRLKKSTFLTAKFNAGYSNEAYYHLTVVVESDDTSRFLLDGNKLTFRYCGQYSFAEAKLVDSTRLYRAECDSGFSGYLYNLRRVDGICYSLGYYYKDAPATTSETGLLYPNFSSKLSVYPNPVANLLNIENLPQNTVIYIHDIAGRLLLQTRQTQLNVSSLAAGVYILRAGNENIRFVKE